MEHVAESASQGSQHSSYRNLTVTVFPALEAGAGTLLSAARHVSHGTPSVRSPDGDRLDIPTTLVEEYERKVYPMDLPDAVTAIEYAMERSGLSGCDQQQ